MALKITLKPHEKFILGGAVIANGDTKSTFVVENDVPILRGKNIMTLTSANTPCKRIYFAIQLMYVDGRNMAEHHKTYWELVRDVVAAAPSTKQIMQEISECILKENYYQSLKLAKKLIEYEEEVINSVRIATGSL